MPVTGDVRVLCLRISGALEYRAERRLPLYLSQGGKERAIQFFCAGPLHLGFNHEPSSRFLGRAFRSQLVESLLAGPGILTADSCPELEVHLSRAFPH